MAFRSDDIGGMPSAGRPAGGGFNSSTLNDYTGQLAAGRAATTQFGSDDEGPLFVYAGKKLSRTALTTADSTPRGFGNDLIGYVPSVKDKQASVRKLVSKFDKMDTQEMRRLAFLLVLAGYKSGDSVDVQNAAKTASNMTITEVTEAYTELLTDASNRWMFHRQKVTPDQLLARAIDFRLSGVGVDWNGNFANLDDSLNQSGIFSLTDKTPGASGGIATTPEGEKVDLSGTQSVTQTKVTRDILDPADAKAMVRRTLVDELGREPTAAEFEDFISAALNAQRRNPTTTTSTRTVSTNRRGKITEDETQVEQESGIGIAGVQDQMTEQARRQPGWAEWQAVGTYAPALFQALGATVPGV